MGVVLLWQGGHFSFPTLENDLLESLQNKSAGQTAPYPLD